MTAAAFMLAAALLLPAPTDTVAVTETGTTYHRPGAAHVARFPVLLVTRAEADSAGYRPCRPCYAPPARKARPWDRLRRRP